MLVKSFINNTWTNCGGWPFKSIRLVADDYGWPPKNINFLWQRIWKTHAMPSNKILEKFFSCHNGGGLIQKLTFRAFSNTLIPGQVWHISAE
jgi:hypothetical protein